MLGWIHTAIGDVATWKDLLWLARSCCRCSASRASSIAICAVGDGSRTGHAARLVLGRRGPRASTSARSTSTRSTRRGSAPGGASSFLTLAVPLTRGAGMGPGSRSGAHCSAPGERRRVVELERTRAGAVDSQAAELQRIERDLHDGAQARLVALAMDLGMAQEKLDSDPVAARRLRCRGARGGQARAVRAARPPRAASTPRSSPTAGLGPRCRRSPRATRLRWRSTWKLDDRSARGHRGGRLLRRGRGAHQRRQAPGGRALPRAHRPPACDRLELEVSDDGDGGADPARRWVSPGCASASRRSTAGSLVADAHPGTTIRAWSCRARRPRRRPGRCCAKGSRGCSPTAASRCARRRGRPCHPRPDPGAEPDLAVVDVRMPPTFTDEGIRAAIEARSSPRTPSRSSPSTSRRATRRNCSPAGGGGVGYLLKDRVADVREFVRRSSASAGGDGAGPRGGRPTARPARQPRRRSPS